MQEPKSMDMNTGKAVYWHEGQLTVTFYSDLDFTTDKQTIIKSLKLDQFKQSLHEQGYNLRSFREEDIPHLSSARVELSDTLAGDDLENLRGKYFFRHFSGKGTSVVCFFHFEPINGTATEAVASMSDMASLQKKAEIQSSSGTSNSTLDVVKLINETPVITSLSVDDDPAKIGVPAPVGRVMPHWLWSGTGSVTHGCPVTPPVPVEDAKAFGQWKITLQQLADPSLLDKTGKGVSVFVLDTLPKLDQILDTATRAGTNNMLLQEMVKQVRFNYAILPDILEKPNPELPVTGKDIYGRLVGFPLADHGLFIAGIVHDLAPAANIECIRVLNDFGVGNTIALIAALQSIHDRLVEGGELHNKPVVINMSLVTTPPDMDLPLDKDNRETVMSSRDELFVPLQCLTALGACFVASAGNDSDPRDANMNPLEQRFGPRYPAAFAYKEPNPLSTIIPVGAVNQKGEATSYSNYPGPHGIAAYGGEFPKPDPWLPSAISHVITHVDTACPIEALRGVYSAPRYPALSKNDPYPPLSSPPPAYPEYSRPNTNAWAYWSGTSFATPIITALAGRVLEGQSTGSVDVRETIISAAAEETIWKGLESGKNVSGPMIMVEQIWWSPDSTSKS